MAVVKVRYDVARPAECGTFSYRTVREAFDIAKKSAAYYNEEMYLCKLMWDEEGRITQEAVFVDKNGKWRRI